MKKTKKRIEIFNHQRCSTMIKKFRKKPVVIKAIRWTGNNYFTIKKFVETKCYLSPKGKDMLVIHTLEGVHEASKGDWIIRGVKGEFYPCKPDIFEQTYEEVTETERNRA